MCGTSPASSERTCGTGYSHEATGIGGNMLKLTGYTIYYVNTRPRWVLLKLTTNEGISGFGELTWHGIQGSIHITRLRELLDQFVIGQSPFFIEKLWSQWYL